MPTRVDRRRTVRLLAAVALGAFLFVLAGVLVAIDDGPDAGAPASLRSSHGGVTGPRPLVDPEEIVSGGPPPDGIPPIDRPRFLGPPQVRFLHPAEPVLSVEVNGDARAYPLRILMWHEIVNDTIGGVPVTVTYCPLCNSGVAFRRPTVAGELLDFGTSGKLYRSNLVMYDRQTRTYWLQATGQAVLGELTGVRLSLVPAQIVSWADWRAANPDGLVLSQRTGFDRDYGENPYEYYDIPSSSPIFLGTPDSRLPPKTRVLGVSTGGESIAFPYHVLRDRARDGWAVLHTKIAGRPLAVIWKQGTVSALDRPRIPDSREVGSAAAFSPVLDGRRLRLQAGLRGIVDTRTGSRFDILGRAIDGPLAGERLEPVPAVDHFWFSWAAFFPDTDVFRG